MSSINEIQNVSTKANAVKKVLLPDKYVKLMAFGYWLSGQLPDHSNKIVENLLLFETVETQKEYYDLFDNNYKSIKSDMMEVIKKKNSTEDTKNPVDDKNVGKNKKKDTAALSNDTTESGSEQGEKVVKPTKPTKPTKSTKVAKGTKEENVEKVEEGESAAKEVTDVGNAEKVVIMEKVSKNEKAAKAEKVGKVEKMEKLENAEKVGKVGKPEKIAKVVKEKQPKGAKDSKPDNIIKTDVNKLVPIVNELALIPPTELTHESETITCEITIDNVLYLIDECQTLYDAISHEEIGTYCENVITFL